MLVDVVSYLLQGGTLAAMVTGVWQGIRYLSGLSKAITNFDLEFKEINKQIAIMNHNFSLEIRALAEKGVLTAEVISQMYKDPDTPQLRVVEVEP